LTLRRELWPTENRIDGCWVHERNMHQFDRYFTSSVPSLCSD
jgi:hypothetical protein